MHCGPSRARIPPDPEACSCDATTLDPAVRPRTALTWQIRDAGYMKHALLVAAKYLLLTLLLYPLGVFCHEVLGHVLVGVLVGGSVADICILGLQVWPGFSWVGWDGRYGYCDVECIPTATGDALSRIAGAMSTWFVSVVAIIALWLRRWRGPARALLACLSLWWLDLLTYLLPSWGLRRSVFWGGSSYSEPYQAAMELGVPGRLFQAFGIASSALLLTLLTWRLLRVARGDRVRQSCDGEAGPAAVGA